MRTTASLDMRTHGPLLHERGELGEHAGIRLREHAVAEIEDVPAAVARALEHVERGSFDALPRAEEHRRVEVALHRGRELPAELERDAPVESDHVAAGARERAQQLLRRTGAEVDRRRVDGGEDACRMWRDELLV